MKALVFDTETTGLVDNVTIADKHLPDIIEFYGCLVDLSDGTIIKDYHSLVKPRNLISEEITTITKITNDMLKDAPAWKDIVWRVVDMIQLSPMAIAHNASYDKEMIDLECHRVGGIRVPWPHILCTVEQTIHLKGFRLSLSALHEYLFNESFEDAHRAKTDTMALVRCCVELYKRELI